MAEHAGADVVRFGGFRFDRTRRCLLRQDEYGAHTTVSSARARSTSSTY